jgi:hypothetical protein
VSFSPASKLLAAAGDSRVIALYDVISGEQVANLTGHGGWVLSLDWSDTGEYLLSGYVEHSYYIHEVGEDWIGCFKVLLSYLLTVSDPMMQKLKYGASKLVPASLRILMETDLCGRRGGCRKLLGRARCLHWVVVTRRSASIVRPRAEKNVHTGFNEHVVEYLFEGSRRLAGESPRVCL